MLHKTLSFIARVGIVAYLVYLAWPNVCFLWSRALTGSLSLMGWTCLAYMLLFGIALVLALIVAALIVVFCQLCSMRDTFNRYLNLILSDATSLPYGR